MEQAEFLRTVITGKAGWFCLAYSQVKDNEEETTKTWIEEFYSWPDELHVIVNRIAELGSELNIYFSPYLFKERSSLKQHAIVGRTIVADLDEANVLTLTLRPTILVETSPERHQGYWILKEELDADEHESLSKRLTYSIPRCDRTGWFLGKKVRIPDTFNHKYTTGPKHIRVVESNIRTYTNQELEDIASTREIYGTNKLPVEIDEDDDSWANKALSDNDGKGPLEMLSSVARIIGSRTYTQYTRLATDRSVALWSLMLSLFRAGLPRDKVFFIAYNSVNNKFKDLRYGGIKELAKDVIRAELATKIQLPDIKAKIKEARNLGGSAQERSDYMATCVIEHLSKIGTFYHASDDSVWYVREDNGRPIRISLRSEQMRYMIDNVFGINASEKEASYVASRMASHVENIPVNARIATLSHYESDTRTFLLHTGRKDVLMVTESAITRVSNGYNGIIFPWSIGNSTISPNYKSLDRDWDEEIFGDCLTNVLGIGQEDARAILRVWFITILLREGLVSRPILALFGAPGSGKSTLFRRIYTLIYGRDRAINAVTDEEDFDYATASDPLVVLDNVDTWEKWLPDRLALSAATSEIVKRKLYTDGDIVTLKRQAMLGITAHNPKFNREDVTDRLLLLNFERLKHFQSETEILEKILYLRNGLWGAILQDIQKVLSTDIPRRGYPQFRVEDFARFGYWIATALGIADNFVRGINTISDSQKVLNIEEDLLLLEAIDKYLGRNEGVLSRRSAGYIWMQLSTLSSDQKGFNKRYTNAVSLGRKLFTLQDTLKDIYDVEWDIDSNKKTRVWTISKKLEGVPSGTT